MKVQNIKIPIYFGILRVVVSNDLKEAERALKLDVDDASIGFDSYVLNTSPKTGLSSYTVIIKPNATPSIVAHEAFHVMSMIFKDRGIAYDTDNDEPAAYFLSWLVESIFKAIKTVKS